MKDLCISDNPVLISRISALLDGDNIKFVVLGGHASLFGGGIGLIQSRIMVEKNKHPRAALLIRDEGLDQDVDIIE
ncbi:MAG: DUF2007 domain-containing protein [Emcibacteraceae bacterium]|nr:DUF2007 domain-containing protein [Emcibacteraceae bacterium]MDG1995591.1 DUF2007 domain-containing protein [Emcibacteraceae bacterium]